MKLLTSTLTCLIFTGFLQMVSDASGQYRDPRPAANQRAPQNPSSLDYLNLFRDGGDIGFNYLTLVKPREDLRQHLGQQQTRLEQQNQTNRDLQRQLQDQQQLLDQNINAEPLPTRQGRFLPDPFTTGGARPSFGISQGLRPTGRGGSFGLRPTGRGRSR